MPKNGIDIRLALQELGAAPKLPTSRFQGRYIHLQINYSYFSDRYPDIMDALMELEPVIGKAAVLEVMEQVLWRVMEGREAVRDFLLAVFGEVNHVG
jgi:hypothetical protein